MKPTEQAVKEAAAIAHNKDNRKLSVDFKIGFKEGYQQAISQMQPEWVALEKVRIDEVLSEKFNTIDHNLIMLLFDNGDILRYNEEHPFAEITHVHFLPQPPAK